MHQSSKTCTASIRTLRVSVLLRSPTTPAKPGVSVLLRSPATPAKPGVSVLLKTRTTPAKTGVDPAEDPLGVA